ncbi:DUF2169 domain-containing protein [Caballeronia sp. GAWG2-1]|uniref:DUF2169 family type VI secretion system accessory protein n=1 Tax=Caballeronia sp. GAWG2-1 TaxID=2921744 RepID=UPI002028201F|nr:DUF2169 domain-containing protein [Caballeronia sp. GAWG2-1]
MKIVKPDNLAVLHRTLRFERRDLLAIGLLAMFPLDRRGVAHLDSESALWQSSALALGNDALLDAGFPKPRGEWLAYGAAFAPGPQPATLLATTVQIGGAQKELYVSGDRYFEALGISKPEPFLRMPMDASRAYGGPAFAANPLGRGAAPVTLPSGATRQPLPNVEAPGRLIAQSGDVRDPAGYWAKTASAPRRAAFLGAFDDQWLAATFPHLPAGTQTDYFCTAPADQRIDGFWIGDERIAVRNMHPSEALLEGQLPGLRARCFVNRLSADGAHFEECAARAETVWLFPESQRGVILYRAVAAIADEDADDVTHVVAAWEAMSDAPAPLATYHAWMLAESAPQDVAAPQADTAQQAPSPAPAETPASGLVAAPAAVPAEIPGLAELEKLGAELEAQSQALMKQHGLSAKDIEPYLPPEPVAAQAKSSTGGFDSLMKEVETMTSDVMKQHGLTAQEVEQAVAAARKTPEPSVTTDIRALGDEVRAAHAQMQAKLAQSGKSFEQLAAQSNDAQTAAAIRDAASLDIDAFVTSLDALTAVLPSAATTAPQAPQMPQTPPDAPAIAARLTREDVLARVAAGESLAGLDLSELDLSNAPLERADFRGALLDGARLYGSRLAGADFSKATLAEADFSDADLRGASLAGASARGALFKAARLDDASLEAGDFSAADFSAASLAGSNCGHAQFNAANMTGLRAVACGAPKATFEGCTLSGADFTDASLAHASLDGAALDGASFVNIDGEGLRLYAVRAAGARFDQANLAGSRSGLAADLSGASLARANLAAASWIGIDMSRAIFDGSFMERANFSGAKAAGARFVGVQAKSAQFAKADLTHADLSRANLMNATLRRAQLEGAQCVRSNLYGAQCYGSNIGRANLEGANIDRTLLAIPGRAEAEH